MSLKCFRATLHDRWRRTCPSSGGAGRSLQHHTLWCSCKWRILGKSCQSLSSHSECSRRWKTCRRKFRGAVMTQQKTIPIQCCPHDEATETRDNAKNAQDDRKCCRWKHWLVFLQLLKVSCVPLRALKIKEREPLRRQRENGLHICPPYHCQHTSPTKRKLQSHTTSWWKHTSVRSLTQALERTLCTTVK